VTTVANPGKHAGLPPDEEGVRLFDVTLLISASTGGGDAPKVVVGTETAGDVGIDPVVAGVKIGDPSSIDDEGSTDDGSVSLDGDTFGESEGITDPSADINGGALASTV